MNSLRNKSNSNCNTQLAAGAIVLQAQLHKNSKKNSNNRSQQSGDNCNNNNCNLNSNNKGDLSISLLSFLAPKAFAEICVARCLGGSKAVQRGGGDAREKESRKGKMRVEMGKKSRKGKRKSGRRGKELKRGRSHLQLDSLHASLRMPRPLWNVCVCACISIVFQDLLPSPLSLHTLSSTYRLLTILC